MEPAPSPQALRRVVRAALRRGIPPADAEDLAVASWERAAVRFDPDRGRFDVFYERVARSQISEWWRQRVRSPEVPLVAAAIAAVPSERLEEVHANQQRLLDALGPEERRLFTTWALQKHLPQGQLTAPRAAELLGLSVAELNNAKRRLVTRIRRLAQDWGLSPRDFFSVEEREGPRRRKHAAG